MKTFGILCMWCRGRRACVDLTNTALPAPTAFSLLGKARIRLEKPWASLCFSWRGCKVISDQGVTQTSTSIIYPGWANVGTLSSAAEGWLERDPPPVDKQWPSAIYLTYALSFVFGCWWFVFLLSWKQRRIMQQNSNWEKEIIEGWYSGYPLQNNKCWLDSWATRALSLGGKLLLLLCANILILDVYATQDSQTHMPTADILFYASTEAIVHVVGL